MVSALDDACSCLGERRARLIQSAAEAKRADKGQEAESAERVHPNHARPVRRSQRAQRRVVRVRHRAPDDQRPGAHAVAPGGLERRRRHLHGAVGVDAKLLQCVGRVLIDEHKPLFRLAYDVSVVKLPNNFKLGK